MSIVHKKNPIVIVVDGIIGAGKTVLIRDCLIPQMVKLGFKVTEVKEPVDMWKKSGRLQQFYQDPAKRAYQFQTSVFHDRIMECRAAHSKFGEETDIFLLERSIFTDMLFMNMLLADNLIDDSEYEDYHKMWTMWRELMPFSPDLFVYLRPDVNECMKRLKERNRDGESKVSEIYQENLMKEHDTFLSGDSVRVDKNYHVPLLVLETNKDFRTDVEVQEKLTKQVIDMLEKVVDSAERIERGASKFEYLKGEKGEKGERGPRGCQGERGPMGHRGHIGCPGEMGPPGHDAATCAKCVEELTQYEDHQYCPQHYPGNNTKPAISASVPTSDSHV